MQLRRRPETRRRPNDFVQSSKLAANITGGTSRRTWTPAPTVSRPLARSLDGFGGPLPGDHVARHWRHLRPPRLCSILQSMHSVHPEAAAVHLIVCSSVCLRAMTCFGEQGYGATRAKEGERNFLSLCCTIAQGRAKGRDYERRRISATTNHLNFENISLIGAFCLSANVSGDGGGHSAG